MKGKYGSKASARHERLMQEQDRRNRDEAASVADALEAVREGEESVADLAQAIFGQLASQELADAAEVRRLSDETERLLRESVAREAAVEKADRRFKQWFQLLEEEIGRRAAIDVRPRLIPDSGNAGIAKGDAVKVVGLWARKPHQPWREKFLDKQHALGGNRARPWDGMWDESKDAEQ